MQLSAEGYKVFDTDNIADCDALKQQSVTYGFNEVWQRPREKYGYCSVELLREYGIPGFEMVDADKRPTLLDPSEYKDAIIYATEQEVMPFFYTYKWRPKGSFRWNQNGLGYCWTWSGTGCVLTTRAIERKPLQYLAPVSMGYLVNWSNSGNYLSSFVKGAREKGIYPCTLEEVNSTSRSASRWPFDEKRSLYLLDEVWDLNDGSMTQQCITCLCAGRSTYIAYNWWGHALELVGIRYNGSTLEWIISNSHNETDFIILTGSRAIPSEAIAFVSTRSTNEPSYDRMYLPEGIAL